MSPSISPKSIDVVIPSYNSAETIERCLRGVTKTIDQSRREGLCDSVHIYIVDDGSTDSSIEHIQRFINTSVYPSTLLRQAQQGPSGARNSGTEAGTASWVLYIDSDVEPHETALSNLIQLQSLQPDCLAINGHPQQHVPNGSWITHYTNLSLCYQLMQHGPKVNTAFTSLCLMSRDAWSEMGGWDASRTSRYSDDIQSRWYFPPNSIAQCFDGLFIHHKHVRLFGLMKHRFNLGFHFRSSLSRKGTRSNSQRILHWRYPVNVICALSSPIVLSLPFIYPSLWFVSLLWCTPMILVNNALIQFVRASKPQRFNTPFHLMSIFGLSYCEGCAMGLGLLISFCQDPFNGRFHDN